MLKWLCKKAKCTKACVYLLGGVAVASSIATEKLLPAVSWTSALVTTCLASLYSIVKNIQVAYSFKRAQEENVSTYNELNLKGRYKRAHTLSTAEILRAVNLNADLIDQRMTLTNAKLCNLIPYAAWYVSSNAAVQILLSWIIIIINSLANSEKTEVTHSFSSEASTSKNSWTNMDYLNLIVLPTCIIAQYCWHSFYTARGLKKMAEETTTLHTDLTRAHTDTFFRIQELNAIEESKAKIQMEVAIHNKKHEKINKKKDKLSDIIKSKEEQLSEIEGEIEDIAKDFSTVQEERGALKIEFKKLATVEKLKGSPEIDIEQPNTEKPEELEAKSKFEEEMARKRNRLVTLKKKMAIDKEQIVEKRKSVEELSNEIKKNKQNIAKLLEYVEREQKILQELNTEQSSLQEPPGANELRGMMNH
jgi:hypothetical protein